MTLNSNTMGIGIIGCGNISTTYLGLAPLFKGLQVVAVADMNMETATARAAEYKVQAQTVDALLANPDVGLVINLTIPAAHYAITRQAVEAGKHVYSEKPVVLTLAEGVALRDLAAAKGVRIGSAPDTFLGGAHQQVRQMIDDGAIGRVTAGGCAFMGPGMEMWHPTPHFFFQPGAGPMLDMGPYYIGNLINFLGPIRRVGALASSAHTTRTVTSQPNAGQVIPVNTPTNIHALLEFVNGATINLSVSWDVQAHKRVNMELYGTEGSLFVPDPNFFGGVIEMAGKDGKIAPVKGWDHPLSKDNQDHGRGPLANYRMAGVADMVAAIATGRDHRCSFERSLHAVDAMTAALTSGETGQFVTLTTTCTRPAALGPQDAAALLV
jgi:predicted dehydrogenase